jgi:hypothetical protein
MLMKAKRPDGYWDNRDAPCGLGFCSTEPCRNCGSSLGAHAGWSCAATYAYQRYEKVPVSWRFLGSWMPLDGYFGEEPAAAAPPPAPEVPAKPQWLQSRAIGLQPGECVCGIPRGQCDYHRPATTHFTATSVEVSIGGMRGMRMGRP